MHRTAMLFAILGLSFATHGSSLADEASKSLEWSDVDLVGADDGYIFDQRSSQVFEVNGKYYCTGKGHLWTVDGNKISKIQPPDDGSLQLYRSRFGYPKLRGNFCVAGYLVGMYKNQCYLIDGTSVQRLETTAGKPLKGAPARYALGDVHCPYVVFRSSLYKIVEGKAERIELPKEIIFPHFAMVGDKLFLATGKDFWIYEDGKATRFKGKDGKDFSDLSVTDLEAFGEHLLIVGTKEAGKGGKLRHLHHFDGKEMTLVRTKEGSRIHSIHRRGSQLILHLSGYDDQLVDVNKDKVKIIKPLNNSGIPIYLDICRDCVISYTKEKLFIYNGKKLQTVKMPKFDTDSHAGFLRVINNASQNADVDSPLCLVVLTEGSNQKSRLYSVTAAGKMTLLEAVERSIAEPAVGDLWYAYFGFVGNRIYASRSKTNAIQEHKTASLDNSTASTLLDE